MRPPLSSSLVILLCLVVAGLCLVAPPVAAQADDGANNVSQTIEVHVDSDGDAEFRVVTTVEAETAEQRAAFEGLATEFERGQFEDRSLWTVALAVFDRVNDETDREMQLEGPNRETFHDEEDAAGHLVLIFEWNGFARAADERLEVGDAWTFDDELWIRNLGDRQTLELHVPEEYDVEEAQPDSFRDRALVWEGPRSFTPDDLTATYTRSVTDITESIPAVAIGVVGIALVLIVGGLYVIRVRDDGRSARSPADSPAADEAPEAADEESSPATDADPSRDGAVETSTAPDAEATGEGGIDPELLSDEERVVRLLRENGGRMKQANIVKETGWSNAKVSQLLSKMDEDGRIDKLRLGRENLIALPEEDITEIE